MEKFGMKIFYVERWYWSFSLFNGKRLEFKVLSNFYAYHCRGWNKKFRYVFKQHKLSMKGDWVIHLKKFYQTHNQLVHFIYLIFKSLIVFTEITFRKVLLKK